MCGICLSLLCTWKVCSETAIALLFANSWQLGLTPAEQDSKQPDSCDRPKCRLDWLPPGMVKPWSQTGGRQPGFSPLCKQTSLGILVTVVETALAEYTSRNLARRKHRPRTFQNVFHIIVCGLFWGTERNPCTAQVLHLLPSDFVFSTPSLH